MLIIQLYNLPANTLKASEFSGAFSLKSVVSLQEMIYRFLDLNIQ
jgi:hypothetical protein